MLATIYARVAYKCPARYGLAKTKFHTKIIIMFRIAPFCFYRSVSYVNPFLGTPSCRQSACYCLLPTAMVADLSRILLELNTSLTHPVSTKLGGVFSLISTAIFISTIVVGSSSSSASDLPHITIRIPRQTSLPPRSNFHSSANVRSEVCDTRGECSYSGIRLAEINICFLLCNQYHLRPNWIPTPHRQIDVASFDVHQSVP